MRKKLLTLVIVGAFALGLVTGLAVAPLNHDKATEELKASARSADETTREVAQEVRTEAKEKWEAVKEGGKEAATAAKKQSVSLWQRFEKAWKAFRE